MGRHETFKALLQDHPGIYVEIGTCWGGFTEWLKENTPATKIITIDPYRKWSSGYEDALNEMTQEEMNKKFLMVAHRLSPLGVAMIRQTSYKAADIFPDNSITFCYIDGNHSYSAVLSDLVRWWPKVKPGGFLCGDDVEDITVPHDEEGNLFLKHEFGGYGKYGVHQALKDFQKIHPSFHFILEGNQFISRK
jgi:predicted O-methyltransferase YrrM